MTIQSCVAVLLYESDRKKMSGENELACIDFDFDFTKHIQENEIFILTQTRNRNLNFEITEKKTN